MGLGGAGARRPGAPPAASGGAPNKSDEVPRLDDLLPPNSKDRPPAPPERREERGEARSTDKWGAVAHTADGAFGASYGIDNRTDAERLAVDECRREAVDKHDCSNGVVTRQDNWFHVQILPARRGVDHADHHPVHAG